MINDHSIRCYSCIDEIYYLVPDSLGVNSFVSKVRSKAFRSFIKIISSNKRTKSIALVISSRIYGALENFNYNFIENGESWLIKVLSKYKNSTLIDIGSNIGNYSLELEKYIRGVKIYSIEASPMTYKKLVENTSEFPNIFPINKALSDSSGQATLYERDEFSGRNTLNGVKNGINYKPGIWHFPLISTEDMNFLVVDRKGSGENLVIENFDKEEIVLKY